MTTSRALTSLSLAATLALSACGGSDSSSGPSNGGDQLTAAELSGVLDAMGAIGIFGFDAGTFAGDRVAGEGLAAQTQSATVDINESVACPGGGTNAMKGKVSYTINTQSGSFNYTIDLTQTFKGCKGTGDGVTYTFDGNPNMTQKYNVTYNQNTSYSLTGTQKGGFRWSGGGKSGSCSMDLNVTVNFTAAGAYSGSVTGTVCGQSVSESLTA